MMPSQIIFYIHGGGFACTQMELYDASMTFLVRQGYTVVGIDYPLAPGKRHPQQIVSILNGMEHALMVKKNYRSCHVIGDSAGGNLALQVAAVLKNPELFAPLLQRSFPGFSVPRVPVSSVISIYGMMGEEFSMGNSLWNRVADATLHLLWRNLEGPEAERGHISTQLPPQFTEWLLRFAARMKLPPVMLTCGDQDVVLPSTVNLARRLKSRGYEHVVRIYPGIHAFFGLPPAWTMGAYYKNAMPCSLEMVQFLKRNDPASGSAVNLPRSRHVTFEWYSMVVYSLIFPGIPVVLAGIPTLMALMMASIYRTKGIQQAKALILAVAKWAGRFCGFWGFCFLVDAARAILRRDEIEETGLEKGSEKGSPG